MVSKNNFDLTLEGEHRSHLTGANNMRDSDIPLVVDLDGTLINSDLLYESFFSMLSAAPLSVAMVIPWLLQGKAALKKRIAERSTIDYATLPFNKAALALIAREKEAGRRIILASASDQSHVTEIASHLNLFDRALGSNDINLAGDAKAEKLVELFGEKGFDYVGNSDADLAVWKRARRAVAVNCSKNTVARLRNCGTPFETLDATARNGFPYFKQLRPHQWVKNLLVFLPALAAHKMNAEVLLLSFGAFVAFSLCASCVYVMNDLVDLGNDRRHPTKRFRPLASGDVPIFNGLLMAVILFGASFAAAAQVGGAFLVSLSVYFTLTVAYSLRLKRHTVVDVITLAILYTLRVVAGGLACGIPASPWLLAFASFIFLMLAMVKRLVEMKACQTVDDTTAHGRGYHVEDIPVLTNLAGVSGYAAILVLALYINSPAVVAQYANPDFLWGACASLTYWVNRLLVLANRGLVNQDPVLFAIKDRVSLGVAVMVLVIGVISAF